MNRIQREELIERYLGGQMTPGEEERFLIDVASNPELRHDLKASQVIESALRKDRSYGTIPTGKMRAELAALLVPAQQMVQTPEEPVSSLSSGFFSSWGAGVITGALALVVFYGVFSEAPPTTDQAPSPTVEAVEAFEPSTIVLDDVAPAPVERSKDILTPEQRPVQRDAAAVPRNNEASESTEQRVASPSVVSIGMEGPDLEADVPEFDQTVTDVPATHLPDASLSHSEENNTGGTLGIEFDKPDSSEGQE